MNLIFTTGKAPTEDGLYIVYGEGRECPCLARVRSGLIWMIPDHGNLFADWDQIPHNCIPQVEALPPIQWHDVWHWARIPDELEDVTP